MNPVREMACGGAAALACAVVGWGTAQVFAPEPAPKVETITTNVRTHCAEDDPCWNCSRMGNRRCGPGTLYVRPSGVIERR